MNCAGLNASEERVITQRKENLLLYRCQECKNNGGVNPAKFDLVKTYFQQDIEDIRSNAKEGAQAKKDVDHVVSVIIPKLKEDIKSTKNEKIEEVNDMLKRAKNIIIKTLLYG